MPFPAVIGNEESIFNPAKSRDGKMAYLISSSTTVFRSVGGFVRELDAAMMIKSLNYQGLSEKSKKSL